METTIKRLRSAYRKSVRRRRKAIARYNKLAGSLYMALLGEMVSVKRICLRNCGYYEQVSAYSTVFYRKDRHGRFYVKDYYCNKRQPCTWCAFCGGSSCEDTGSEEFLCRDYLDLCKLEAVIKESIDECESLLGELERLGVDVYNDAELWGI